MENKRKTKRDFFNEIIEICEDCEREDLIEFCNHEIELLNKKASTPSKADKAKDTLKDIVYEVVAIANRPISIAEMVAEYGDMLEPLKNENGIITPQRMSAYLKKLKDEGKVDSTKDKKKTLFFVL